MEHADLFSKKRGDFGRRIDSLGSFGGGHSRGGVDGFRGERGEVLLGDGRFADGGDEEFRGIGGEGLRGVEIGELAGVDPRGEGANGGRGAEGGEKKRVEVVERAGGGQGQSPER